MKSSTGDRYVAKKLISSHGPDTDRQVMKNDILIQCVSQLLTEKFNGSNPPKSLKYVPVKLMQIADSKEILAVKIEKKARY
jgi:hypothetical protein